jgi:ADP-ribose pyrophosphatase YjhB (NUDIX family)
VLLVRRAQEPGKGNWTNPGGYIEQKELIQDTIRRKMWEEAGVEAEVRRIIAVRDQPRQQIDLFAAAVFRF